MKTLASIQRLTSIRSKIDMHFKLLSTILLSLFCLGTIFVTVAQAQVGGGEGGGNVQSPVQVIVQIVVTAIVLRVLNKFNLP